jgi:hypothetical protein
MSGSFSQILPSIEIGYSIQVQNSRPSQGVVQSDHASRLGREADSSHRVVAVVRPMSTFRVRECYPIVPFVRSALGIARPSVPKLS